MDRKKGILAAGTFTGLILITILALGFGNIQTSAANTGNVLPETAVIVAPSANEANADQALQEWQTYSAELEQTIQTLQERDTAYQQQLDTANETITNLQDEINAANSAPVYGEEGEHEEHEAHEYYEQEEYDD